MVFLWRGHKYQHETNGGVIRKHILLRLGSTLCSVMFAAFIVGFFVYGPRSIGKSIDIILAVLLAGGVVFAFASKRDGHTFIFDGHDLMAPEPRPDRAFETPTPVEIT